MEKKENQKKKGGEGMSGERIREEKLFLDDLRSKVEISGYFFILNIIYYFNILISFVTLPYCPFMFSCLFSSFKKKQLKL